MRSCLRLFVESRLEREVSLRLNVCEEVDLLSGALDRLGVSSLTLRMAAQGLADLLVCHLGDEPCRYLASGRPPSRWLACVRVKEGVAGSPQTGAGSEMRAPTIHGSSGARARAR
ncbi:MAG: hypothetical protein AB1758_12020 [Candidatus Eremiobacterota bacterium]